MKPGSNKPAAKSRPLPPVEEGRIRLAVCQVEHTKYSGENVSFFLDNGPLQTVPIRKFLDILKDAVQRGVDVVICRTTAPTLQDPK